MKMKKGMAFAAFAAMAAGLVGMGIWCVRLHARVRELERGVPAAVSTKVTNEVVRATNAAPKAVVAAVVTNLPPQMAVVEIKYEGENRIDILLSERPDMENIRRFVSVSPLAEGRLNIGYRAFGYSRRYDKHLPTLVVRGEFAFRTNCVLKIAKGLPLFGKGANPDAEGSLKEDFTYAFRRKDKNPYVAFAADGRYLPPGGKRAIEIESMNVSNVFTSVRRVEPRNVVQLLAREEGAYRRSYDPDDEDTQELAGEPVTNVFRCVNRPNDKEMTRLSVDARDGKPANGIYFVSILNADRPRSDWAWKVEDENPMHFRVVCLSDLGLSVRKSGTDELGVWVTSLTSGKPVVGAWVDVYSSANIKVMEGRSDLNGWCVPKRIDKGEPFAVVVIAPEGDDMTFMALRNSMAVDETFSDEGERMEYLKPDEIKAFLWTDRGIYRHGEKIFAQAMVRNGQRRAPKPLPLELELKSPAGHSLQRTTALTDAEGTLRCETFTVSAEQPSGIWTIAAKVPGKDGRVFGERKIKIEEFAPPQIRVSVAADESAHPSNFAFTVSAEHLFGGPANGLRCEGAVVFEDVPFAPVGWKGWHFGNEDLGLKPCFRTIDGGLLDANGTYRFTAPLWADTGLPKAAVRATGQGVVFEDGGRPATMRQSVTCHYYPYYIGSTLPGWLKHTGKRPQLTLACVAPDGKRLGVAKQLVMRVERIDSIYSYRERDDGWNTWDCERIRTTVAEGIAITTKTDADTVIEMPIDACGDYAVTVEDPVTRTSFGRTFYLSDWGDNTVRAPLADPTAVTLTPDKQFYREGETPHLTVRAPFTGYALLSVMREKEIYTEVINLTNATSVIALRPVAVDNAPSLDVYISVVQSVADNAKHLAVRAKGQTMVCVRPTENEVEVKVAAEVKELKSVEVNVEAPGATYAVVTVVDEAINLLTGERTPDPVGHFAAPCTAVHPLYDLYHRILPVVGEEGLKRNGVKTGGGFGAEMLGRVSPVPTRRFKPLARWSGPVALTNGRGTASISLPEFVGEVRVTAVAYSAKATGAASVQLKVTPKLVVQPDAPRFVAPGDEFEVSLPIRNRSGAETKFGYEIECHGKMVAFQSLAELPRDGMTNIVARVQAPKEPGELAIGFHVRGAGEVHDETIFLPVRPAVAWMETAGVEKVKSEELGVKSEAWKTLGWTNWRVFDSPVGELSKAMEYLADYPHGCLEQTCSRIFPLLTAGEVLAAAGSAKTTNRAECVAAGVKRVESMVRENDFVMWPDCNYAPWDREVSLYAAHFLIEAERAGKKLNTAVWVKVIGFLGKWAMETNLTVSVYACHTLALAGKPEKDRMLSLYDRMSELSLLDRARLARAFVALHDRTRAETLLKNAASPSSVREAAFAVLALLELDPDDPRILPLVEYLNGARDKTRFCWGTTGENAQALLALGAYFRAHPPQKGEKFVVWRKLSLPDVSTVTDESHGIRIARRFLTPEGTPIMTNEFRRGEMVVVELSLEADDTRTLSDLVIEDLFAGAFEPIHGNAPILAPATNEVGAATWVMRSDARDDRTLVFSKKFHLEKGRRATFRYPIRVVSAGDYVLPGPSVEAMYFPALKAKCAPTRIRVGK